MFAIRSNLDRARAYHALARGLDSGLPLTTALRLQSPNPGGIGRAVASAAAEVERGCSLAEALGKVAPSAGVPDEEVELLAAGEASGSLPELLLRLSSRLEERAEQSRKFAMGLIYPTILLHLAILAGSAPRVVAGLGPFLAAVVPPFVLLWGCLAVAYLLIRLARAGEGRRRAISFAARLPVVGPAVRSSAAAEYAIGASLALEAGLPIADSLRLSGRTTGWSQFEAAVDRIVGLLRSGSSLAEAHQGESLIPAELVEAIRVGEETGKLEETFRGTGRLLAETASRRVDFLARAIPFVVYLGVALYVAFVVISGFAGLYSDVSGL